MNIEPIAFFHSPMSSKFGVPRQSGLVNSLRGQVVFVPDFRSMDAVRGLALFDYLWLIWGFSENIGAEKHATVRPPLLGGNKRMGVFATRSPFRPNNIGLSSVRLTRIELSTPQGPVLHVEGADLMDGTPILDIKPYLPFTDSHPEATGGFTDETMAERPLNVEIPPTLAQRFSPAQLLTLKYLLAGDPRPRYQDDPARIYTLVYAGQEVKFRVSNGLLSVILPQ